jgi:hypothetical protein
MPAIQGTKGDGSMSNIERLILRVGFGVFAGFAVLSLLTVWANAGGGMVFSWLTLKYFALILFAALPLFLPAIQKTYMFVFAALLALLAWADLLTYSRDQIRELGTMKEQALKDKVKKMQQEYDCAELGAEVKRLDGYLAAIEEGRAKEYDKTAYENKKKELEEQEKKAKDAFDKARKEAKVADMLDIVEVAWEGRLMEELETSDKNCRDLTRAKVMDFFLLAGAFLMLVGALLGAKPSTAPPA